MHTNANLDLLLGPIVGGLSHKGALLWGRTSQPATLYAWLGRNPDLSDAALAGESLPLRAEDGFAGVAPLQDLRPDTRYHYALTLTKAVPQPSDGPYPSFKTFPQPGKPASFAFAFGSCFRPSDEKGGKIFDQIEARREIDDLRFILLIGDQIYADAGEYNGLGRVACTLDEYRSVYTYTWSRRPFRNLLKNLPAFMTLDDHEVDDDWRWLDHERRWAYIPWWDRLERLIKGRSLPERRIPLKRVQDALQAYWEHQAMHAPHFELPPQINTVGQYELQAQDPGSFAYTFTYGSAAFFVIDTRSMRVTSSRGRSMLGDGQWMALEEWLLAVKDRYPVKFLVTSCALLFRMWLDIPRDRWSGFPQERDRLLHFLAANGIEGVHLLAGDLHSAHAIQADLYGPEGRTLPLWEFCSTPFEQKPNWLARYTYTPLRSGPVKHQHCEFIQAKLNFGIVRVNFSNQDKPEVRFELYGEKGEKLAQAG